jgi:hypothetical protein
LNPGANPGRLQDFEAALKVVALFEGTDFATVAGNFDGQGLSCGVLQWNLGQGSLQNHILTRVNLMMYDFPVPFYPVCRLTNEAAVQWAKDIILDPSGEPKPEWKRALQAMLVKPEVINLQKEACGRYWRRAHEILGQLGMGPGTRRQKIWAFDLAVQNWSAALTDGELRRIRDSIPYVNLRSHAEAVMQRWDTQNWMLWEEMPMTDEQAILVIASHFRAQKCRPEFQRDVFARKATIAMGAGYVHGSLQDLSFV